MRTSQCLLIAALGILIGGCVTTQHLSDEDRKNMSVVRINSPVQKVPRMYYSGPETAGARWFGAFGAIGGAAAGAAAGAEAAAGAAASATRVESAKVLQDFAETNGIFIEQIAFQEIDSALRQSGKLKVSGSGEPAGAIINIAVYQYGFSIPHGLSSNLVPVVAIRCEMVDATGNVIWSASDRVLPLRNPVAPMSLEAMRDNPKRIEDAWRRASKRIAENIAKTL